MVTVTRFNGSKLSLNALLIESVEATPDTLITLTTGKKYLVKEDVETVIALIRSYMQDIGSIQAIVKSRNVEG